MQEDADRITDWELVEAAGRRNSDALGSLIEHHYRDIKAVVGGYLRKNAQDHFSQANLNDIVQGFFLSLLEDPSLIERADKDQGRFRAYLAAIAINRTRNEVAKARRLAKKKSALEDVSTQSTPPQGLDQTLLHKALTKGIEAVKGNSKSSSRDEIAEVLSLMAFDGLKAGEIADCLSCEVTQVYEWIRQGKALLKKEMSRLPIAEDGALSILFDAFLEEALSES